MGSSYSREKSDTAPRRRCPKLDQLIRSDNFAGWMFVAPALLGFAVFYVYPTFRAFAISLTDWNMLRTPRFIGLDNYINVLGDANFWHSCKITALYVLYNIPIQTTLGLFLAILMDRISKSVALRAVVILPYLVSSVVTALIWLWMLDPVLGMVNAFLEFIGAPRQQFLTAPGISLISVAGINIWRHMGFTALLFYAGLQSIPKYLYEAASLEGASEWQMFRFITLPLLRPVMTFVLVTSFIGSFQIFDTIAVTTQGGPAQSTRALVVYIYENGFKFFKMGYASAMSVILFAFLVFFTLVQMRFLRSGDGPSD